MIAELILDRLSEAGFDVRGDVAMPHYAPRSGAPKGKTEAEEDS
jgi:hypothetical protein